jgi:hypothetical protein
MSERVMPGGTVELHVWDDEKYETWLKVHKKSTQIANGAWQVQHICTILGWARTFDSE